MLNRLTFASTLSHLRRLNSPIGREGMSLLYGRGKKNNKIYRKTCKASPTPQHSLGFGMPCGDPRRCCLWASEEPRPYGIHFCRLFFHPNHGIFGRMDLRKLGGNLPIAHPPHYEDFREWHVGWSSQKSRAAGEDTEIPS